MLANFKLPSFKSKWILVEDGVVVKCASSALVYHTHPLTPTHTSLILTPSPTPPPRFTMCDVLPAIGEETPPSSPDEGGDNSKLEQLMISMLEERDKLMEKLRESQEAYTEATKKLGDVESDNKVLLRQLQALMPQVGYMYMHVHVHACTYMYVHVQVHNAGPYSCSVHVYVCG